MTNVKVERTRLPYEEEIAAMITNCDGQKRIRNRAMVSLLYLAGPRIQELNDLKRKDVRTFDDHILISILNMKHRKKGVQDRRTVKLYKNLPFVDNFLYYIRDMDPEKKLFNISRQHIWRIIKKVSNKKIWPYLLRHNRAQKFAENGGTAIELQSWFGWLNLNTGQNYVKRSGKLAEKLADKF